MANTSIELQPKPTLPASIVNQETVGGNGHALLAQGTIASLPPTSRFPRIEVISREPLTLESQYAPLQNKEAFFKVLEQLEAASQGDITVEEFATTRDRLERAYFFFTHPEELGAHLRQQGITTTVWGHPRTKPGDKPVEEGEITDGGLYYAALSKHRLSSPDARRLVDVLEGHMPPTILGVSEQRNSVDYGAIGLDGITREGTSFSVKMGFGTSAITPAVLLAGGRPAGSDRALAAARFLKQVGTTTGSSWGALHAGLTKRGADLEAILGEGTVTIGHVETTLAFYQLMNIVADTLGLGDEIRLAVIGSNGSMCSAVEGILKERGMPNRIVSTVVRVDKGYRDISDAGFMGEDDGAIRTNQVERVLLPNGKGIMGKPNMIISATSELDPFIPAEAFGKDLMGFIDDGMPPSAKKGIIDQCNNVLATWVAVRGVGQTRLSRKVPYNIVDGNEFACFTGAALRELAQRMDMDAGYIGTGKVSLEKVHAYEKLAAYFGIGPGDLQNYGRNARIPQ